MISPEQKNYRRLITTRAIATAAAPRARAGSAGDVSAGGGSSVPSGVGIFSVDFLVMFAVFTGDPVTDVTEGFVELDSSCESGA
jgi:hypothetical protein